MARNSWWRDSKPYPEDEDFAFTPFFSPPSAAQDLDWLFLVSNAKVVVLENDGAISLPRVGDLRAAGFKVAESEFIGTLGKISCRAAPAPQPEHLPENPRLFPIRRLFPGLAEGFFQAAGCANQIVIWRGNTRFCGRCANPTRPAKRERAAVCTVCGHLVYPRISPAVIMAVVKDGRILLANSPRFSRGMHSVLAGFAEPGETLEACLLREVREETGIRVQNPRYFGSQPWPYPDSLMVAFTAEYQSGEIRIQDGEIAHAKWYGPRELPKIPDQGSIARRLIDWFVCTYG